MNEPTIYQTARDAVEASRQRNGTPVRCANTPENRNVLHESSSDWTPGPGVGETRFEAFERGDEWVVIVVAGVQS